MDKESINRGRIERINQEILEVIQKYIKKFLKITK